MEYNIRDFGDISHHHVKVEFLQFQKISVLQIVVEILSLGPKVEDKRLFQKPMTLSPKKFRRNT